MQYIEKTESYNEKRYGKPWLAIVTTSLTKDFEFLDWSGRWGCAGEFVFDAQPGTMLAYGQKDIRKGRGGVGGYEVCLPDGKVQGVKDSDAAALRKMSLSERWHWLAETRLALAVDEYRNPAKYFISHPADRQKRVARAAYWSRMIGVSDPIMADIADALGLIDHPAVPVSRSAAAVSMEAFF